MPDRLLKVFNFNFSTGQHLFIPRKALVSGDNSIIIDVAAIININLRR